MIDLTSHQQNIRENAYAFAKEVLLPNDAMWEEKGEFPVDAFHAAMEAGYGGMLSPQDLGGQGLGVLESALIYESLARGSFPFTFALEVHNIVAYGLWKQLKGNKGLESKVVELSRGEKIGAIALTEPHSGSDPSSMQTHARLSNNHYIINGSKAWVTNGKEADYSLVIVKNQADPAQSLMLLVDKTDQGILVVDSPKKMGANLVSTPRYEFVQCVIPKDRLLSEKGLSEALHIIDMARLAVAAMAIGITQEALEQTVHYLGGRIQFGQPIIKNQGVQWMLADIWSELEAVRWLTYHTAYLVDQGKVPSYKISMAKLRATELAMKATVQCSQLVGANGFLETYPMERFIKYAKMSQIVDGTSQIQKVVIGRKLLHLGR